MRPRRIWWLAAGAVAAWLLWMTLRPQGQVTADLTYLTTPAATRGISASFLVDFLGNIVVFVPLGAALLPALHGKSGASSHLCKAALGATVLGAALSAAIELLQLALPSRVSAWKDWGLNTLGTLTGALMMSVIVGKRKTGA